MSDRLLVRGGHVLTLAGSAGGSRRADVLVEDGRIAAVAPDLDASDCEVLDARGGIVMPGFVDTHRHTWQTALRGICADWTLLDYFRGIRLNISTELGPEDMYAGNYVGALEALDAGVTTLLDFSHCTNTPEHADEAIRGLRESGIRSVFAFGFPNTSLQDWWFGPDYAGSVLEIDGDLARRIRAQYFNSDDGLITMALATRGTNFCREEVVRNEWGLAKELGLNITVHVAMYRFGYTKMQLSKLKEMDLLFPNTTYIHSSHLLDDEWAMVRDSGSNVSYAPQIELQMGHGWAQAVTARDYGVPIGLSSDVATTASSDQFTQMHAIFASERARRYEIAWDENLEWNEPESKLITSRDVLAMATIGGAKVAGIADRTGSLTPGKKADLVIIDTKAVNVAPVIDPVGAVVCAADISNVRTVMVDGQILKDDFRLKADLAQPRKLVEESRDYLVSKFGAPEPGWLPTAVTA